MAVHERISVDSPLAAVGPFAQANVAASQSAVALLTVGGAAQRTALAAGYIVAVEVNLSAAGSAGTLTISPTVGGTAKTAGNVAITTETQKVTKTPRGVNAIPFAAGDALGAKITTDGSWNGTTSEVEVVLHVVYEGYDY